MPGSRRIPQDATFDILHEVERGADDRLVLAQRVHARDRHVGPRERGHHAVLALDRVRGGQQPAWRLAAQHVAPLARRDQVGRIRLPALELLRRSSSPREAADMRAHVGIRASRSRSKARGRARRDGRPDWQGAASLDRRAAAVDASAWPVTWRDASDARNTTLPFRSSSPPNRPSGVSASTSRSMRSSVTLVIFDGKKPGQIALTLMLCSPHSAASVAGQVDERALARVVGRPIRIPQLGRIAERARRSTRC